MRASVVAIEVTKWMTQSKRTIPKDTAKQIGM